MARAKRARPGAFLPDGTRRPYWLLRPVRPTREAYRAARGRSCGRLAPRGGHPRAGDAGRASAPRHRTHRSRPRSAGTPAAGRPHRALPLPAVSPLPRSTSARTGCWVVRPPTGWRASGAPLGREVPGEPDHLSALLGLYAGLADAEARESAGAGRILRRESRKALLWEHLLSWLPPYLHAVGRDRPPLLSAMGRTPGRRPSLRGCGTRRAGSTAPAPARGAAPGGSAHNRSRGLPQPTDRARAHRHAPDARGPGALRRRRGARATRRGAPLRAEGATLFESRGHARLAQPGGRPLARSARGLPRGGRSRFPLLDVPGRTPPTVSSASWRAKPGRRSRTTKLLRVFAAVARCPARAREGEIRVSHPPPVSPRTGTKGRDGPIGPERAAHVRYPQCHGRARRRRVRGPRRAACRGRGGRPVSSFGLLRTGGVAYLLSPSFTRGFT